MKNHLKNTIMLLLTIATTSYASLSIQAGESGLLMWFFMGFASLVVIFQLIPGLTLFAGMIKGLFPNHA